jgi:hypothetical protein
LLNCTYSRLQDIVNQIGIRLGFTVDYGRYRGTSAHIGYDGLWRFPNCHTVIIEVKTTDAYRIALDKLAEYRRTLISQGLIEEAKSSILIVVGRQDTGDLEAQIRGSRYAWDVRLISVDRLLQLLKLKEDVEDPNLVQRIHNILIPREFTRLDEIVDILFSTAEDIKQTEVPEETIEDGDPGVYKPKFVPVAFHEACVQKIQQQLGQPLLKHSRVTYSSTNGAVSLICAISKEHIKPSQRSFWFAFHPHQKEFLASSERSYVALGCGSEKQVLLIPFNEFVNWLDGMNVTQNDDRFYWHVSIFREDERLVLHRRRGIPQIDLTKYKLPE